MGSSSTRSFAKSWADKSISQNLGFDRLLEPAFFERNTVVVARELLGKVLVVHSRQTRKMKRVRIVETEAYREGDPASHSARGKTERCSVMFGHPGFSYVYLIYGMYSMLNFVTEPEGSPGAVLIRAAEPLDSVALLGSGGALTQGPGRLTRHLGITCRDNGLSLCGPRLWVGDDGFQAGTVLCSARVGIRQARDRLWRFFLQGNSYVSRVPENRDAIRLKDEV